MLLQVNAITIWSIKQKLCQKINIEKHERFSSGDFSHLASISQKTLEKCVLCMYYVHWLCIMYTGMVYTYVHMHTHSKKVASRILCTKTSLSFLQRIADLFLDLKKWILEIRCNFTWTFIYDNYMSSRF